jgi:hypothetical protein
MDLLNLDQKNKLHANRKIEEHLKLKRTFYLSIVIRVSESLTPLLPNELDQVDLVAVIIRKTDPDVIGLVDGSGMSLDEICDIFACAAVGDAGH